MNPDSRWLDGQGMTSLKQVGIHPDDHVLDFGCGEGMYTLPAAMLVGQDGMVYAVDRDHKKLEALAGHLERYDLSNVVLVETAGSLSLSFDTGSMDTVLVYDVLHSDFFARRERVRLLCEAARVLSPDGLLSIFPRHMDPDNAVHAAEQAGFTLDRHVTTMLHHNHVLVEDTVLNFRKEQQQG